MSKPIDIIILSNTTDLKHYGLTTRALNTLRASETSYKFNEIIVETNTNYLDRGFLYHNSTVITPNEEFNYNRFLNFGLTKTESDWIVISNNDVIFTKKWFTKLMIFQKDNPDALSLSPFEPNWHPIHGLAGDINCYFGYRAAHEIAGWCIVLNRSVIEKCKLFDEAFTFWYQDNDYGKTLEANNIKHALVVSSRVYHDNSSSHDTVSNKEKLNSMTHNQIQTFNNKWKNI
jgi:GT2 family glycosyltransferase